MNNSLKFDTQPVVTFSKKCGAIIVKKNVTPLLSVILVTETLVKAKRV